MKKILILLMILCSLSALATKRHISPSGDDNTGTGTIGNPWKSLYKACNTVSTVGDTIYVNSGTYIENNECVLAAGVSITGVDSTSLIISNFVTTRGHTINHASITLASTTEGTNGNQSISYIKLSGNNLAGSIGIAVYKRSNVLVHHVIIRDFYINGITFTGQNTSYVKPVVYATGNKIYNCIITNCTNGTANWNGGGNIQWSGQSGFLAYNNILGNTSRTLGKNGDNFQICYYNKGWKFYNNKSYKPEDDGIVNSTTWDGVNFHMEVSTQTQPFNAGDELGGNEIYGNEFYGGNYALDFPSPGNKGAYAYFVSIHDNYFELNVVNTTLYRSGIHLEALIMSDVLIYNNRFKGWAQPIRIIDNGGVGATTPYLYSLYDRISIYNNLIENPAMTTATKYYNIINMSPIKAATTWSNISLYNNTVLSSVNPANYTTFLNITNGGVIDNLNIKNNVIVGHKNATSIKIVNNGSMNSVHIDYNCFYNNAGSNNPTITGNAITNYSFASNIKVNPLFVGTTDYRPQTSSPVINAGLNVGINTDIVGHSVTGNPDIGAYEYYFETPWVLPTITMYLSAVHSRSATAIGNLLLDGGGTISAKGVCWSTVTNPTTANAKTVDGTALGVFTSNITGLLPGTTYYFRAYATNEAGTAYSVNYVFTTSASSVLTYNGKVVTINNKIATY